MAVVFMAILENLETLINYMNGKDSSNLLPLNNVSIYNLKKK